MTVSLEYIQQQFQDAVTDLWWMSETDAPFEVMALPQAFEHGFSTTELMKITELDPALPTQEIPIEQFLAPALREQDWHGEMEKEEVRRYHSLQTLIANSFSEVHVCRIGEVQLDILIVGKTETNDWIALATQAVES